MAETTPSQEQVPGILDSQAAAFRSGDSQTLEFTNDRLLAFLHGQQGTAASEDGSEPPSATIERELQSQKGAFELPRGPARDQAIGTANARLLEALHDNNQERQ